MGVEHEDDKAAKNDKPAKKDDATDTTPLAPGVWITEATGFASVPPRSQSDLSDLCEVKEQERKEDSRGKKPEEPAEPRIERYRER